jgi:glycosyltransferase involved in cell wall biosynthesis
MVLSLIGDPGKRRHLGLAGRQLVERHYSWEQVSREVERACFAAVSRPDMAQNLSLNYVSR